MDGVCGHGGTGPVEGGCLAELLDGVSGGRWVYTAAVGVFGLGNFAHTLLVFYAVSDLTPIFGVDGARRIGLGLYILHNVIYAAASYPFGALGDRVDKTRLLAMGYALFGGLCVGLVFVGSNVWLLGVLFIVAGLYIAIVDAMERAIAADILPLETRATGYGALATVNSVGDFVSSATVGYLFTRVSFVAGFTYGAALTLAGSAALFVWSKRHRANESEKRSA